MALHKAGIKLYHSYFIKYVHGYLHPKNCKFPWNYLAGVSVGTYFILLPVRCVNAQVHPLHQITGRKHDGVLYLLLKHPYRHEIVKTLDAKQDRIWETKPSNIGAECRIFHLQNQASGKELFLHTVTSGIRGLLYEHMGH